MLQPRVCGELTVGAGSIAIGDRLLNAGDKLRLWAGQRVELVNVQDADTALYAWDWCAKQPARAEALKRRLIQILQAFGIGSRPELRECTKRSWCLA